MRIIRWLTKLVLICVEIIDTNETKTIVNCTKSDSKFFVKGRDWNYCPNFNVSFFFFFFNKKLLSFSNYANEQNWKENILKNSGKNLVKRERVKSKFSKLLKLLYGKGKREISGTSQMNLVDFPLRSDLCCPTNARLILLPCQSKNEKN